MKTAARPKPKQREPLWKGPQVDGISFSLLAKFLVCRERFRLKVVEGLVEDEGFNASMEYGTLFHEAEEAHRKGKPWEVFLKKYRTKLLANYPEAEAEIFKWSSICMKQYPLYLEHWQTHEDETCRKPLLAEAAFKVPYLLPSGRTVILRGKFDAVTLLPIQAPPAPRTANKIHQPGKRGPAANGKRKGAQPTLGIFLQENKTKGQIDEEGILGTVSQNLQTMLYQIALRESVQQTPVNLNFQFSELFKAIGHDIKIAGTLYNVIRRPLADHYAIKQREGRVIKGKPGRQGAETSAQFYERVAQTIRDDPKYFFMRWRVLLDDADIERFQQRVFNPILEQLCEWWEWIKVDPFDPWRPRKPSELYPDEWGASIGRDDKSASDRMATDFARQVLEGLDTPHPNFAHYQTPWGIYNSMFGGFRGDYFGYLTADRQHGLTTITNLFPELT